MSHDVVSTGTVKKLYLQEMEVNFRHLCCLISVFVVTVGFQSSSARMCNIASGRICVYFKSSLLLITIASKINADLWKRPIIKCKLFYLFSEVRHSLEIKLTQPCL